MITIICSKNARKTLIKNTIDKIMAEHKVSENTAYLMLYYSDMYQNIKWRN